MTTQKTKKRKALCLQEDNESFTQKIEPPLPKKIKLDQNNTEPNVNDYNLNSNHNDNNMLENELYTVFFETRAPIQHVKNRNDLYKLMESCVIHEITNYNEDIVNNNISLLFGASVLNIDINGIHNASDIDYAVLIQSANDEKEWKEGKEEKDNNNDYRIEILKNLKQRLSKTQITPDFDNQYKETNHYNGELVKFVASKRKMKFANQNRKKLLKDRKQYIKNPYNNIPKQYEGGPYSLKLQCIFYKNKWYLMPLIKITDPVYNICMDLCAVSKEQQNELILNVKLMNYLLNYNSDDRIRPFIVNIKYWCKMREIYKAYNGFINSFCYVLMGIKYLQMVKPPILPIVTDLDNMDNMKLIEEELNISDIDKLVIGFFKFWTTFNYKRFGIDICKKGVFERGEGLHSDNTLIIIDPVNCDNNCASIVDIKGITIIINEFERAAKLLSENKSWIECVCIP